MLLKALKRGATNLRKHAESVRNHWHVTSLCLRPLMYEGSWRCKAPRSPVRQSCNWSAHTLLRWTEWWTSDLACFCNGQNRFIRF